MSNTKKITKREKFEILANIAEVKANPMLVEFIEHELELLAKKNSAEKKPTAVQVANESIKSIILETLAKNEKMMTITEMQKVNAELGKLSNQKISALVKQLVADEKVEKIEEKRKSFFKAL